MLRKRIDADSAALQALEEIPDPALMPVETVIFWQRSLQDHASAILSERAASMIRPRSYMYVAIKVPMNPVGSTRDGAVWYVTGMTGNERYTDDELRETLAHKSVSERYVVGEWIPLAEYVPASPFDSDFDESVNG